VTGGSSARNLPDVAPVRATGATRRHIATDRPRGCTDAPPSSPAGSLSLRWIEDMITFDMDLIRYYREHHGVNEFRRSSKIDDMGGLPRQAYYDGIHELTDDEALILESEIPEECRYWQALVGDDRFCTVDWVNRQSSLNDAQAHIDSDGKAAP
jgi:hypothetical protein